MLFRLIRQKYEIPTTNGTKFAGLYVFVLEGEVKIAQNELGPQDETGVWDTESVTLETATGAELLLMDVPMRVL